MSTAHAVLRPVILAGCTLVGVVLGLGVRNAAAGESEGHHGGLFGNGWSGVQGSGVMKQEARSVAPFHAIALEGAFDMEVVRGPAQAVTLFADDNLLPLITTEVREGTLYVSSRGAYSTERDVHLRVILPRVDAVRVDGSGDVRLSELSGGSLNLQINGSGDISASGSVESLKAGIGGSGDLRLAALDTRRTEISVSGSGDAELRASEELVARVAGSGDIRYHGKPDRLTTKISGSGSIHGD